MPNPPPGQFRAADRVRELLEREGVRVDDKAKCWSTGDGRRGNIAASTEAYQQGVGSMFLEELNGALGTPVGGRANFDRPPSDRPFGQNGGQGRAPKGFGPTGHDYVRVGGTGPLSPPLEKVDAMLAARLGAKLSADYDTADRLKVRRGLGRRASMSA
jgi:hypothetical protein